MQPSAASPRISLQRPCLVGWSFSAKCSIRRLKVQTLKERPNCTRTSFGSSPKCSSKTRLKGLCFWPFSSSCCRRSLSRSPATSTPRSTIDSAIFCWSLWRRRQRSSPKSRQYKAPRPPLQPTAIAFPISRCTCKRSLTQRSSL